MEMPAPDAAVIARRDEIAAALRRIVPGEGVIVSEPERRAYESDGLTAYRQPPLVVVLPSTVAQVAAVLRYCRDERIKVVPRGAGTSLSGGALPLADGVLLGMGKFNRILDIDYDNRCVVAQPGRHQSRHQPCGRRRTAFITRPTRRARSPARSAAMSPRIRAACIA